MKGCIFDISEGTIHDGPGLRTTVFLKGCPLRCQWCHSPEGQAIEPETLFLPTGNRLCGMEWDSADLVRYLTANAYLLGNCGGVTFSGGEPLMQSEFLSDVLEHLQGIHTIVETSGFCKTTDLLRISDQCSLIHFGLKLLDNDSLKKWCGVSVDPILDNLFELDRHSSGAEFVFRIPLLGGIIDTGKNLYALMELCHKLKRLQRIEFLSVNGLAAAKYTACQRRFPLSGGSYKTGEIPLWFSPGVAWSLMN